jgi:hypothetical protein
MRADGEQLGHLRLVECIYIFCLIAWLQDFRAQTIQFFDFSAKTNILTGHYSQQRHCKLKTVSGAGQSQQGSPLLVIEVTRCPGIISSISAQPSF